MNGFIGRYLAYSRQFFDNNFKSIMVILMLGIFFLGPAFLVLGILAFAAWSGFDYLQELRLEKLCKGVKK